MATIDIKSYNQILGDMVRKMIADTPLTDVSTGSVLLTLLEAVATSDYESNTAILNVLELLNIDSTSNNDLDSMAANYGLTRRNAVRATGFISIADASITKRSTSLYPIKPAPIAGSTVLYVNDASQWNATGSLFIGRGTLNFEGPISYSSITNYGTFFAINLSSALQNDHLISESIIDTQGTVDRLVAAGTKVKIPSNNINPDINYTTLRSAVIPSGEDVVTDILIGAEIAGTRGNAGINTITTFESLPFNGAQVTNMQAFINGADVESDAQLRDRIKSYASSLARGTRAAILTAIIGVSDETEGKQVASAVVVEPVAAGEPSLIYIDDGSGFQPSYAGQSVDPLLSSANGGEEFLQLANFPLPRPQVINFAKAPYQLTDGMNLRVSVDGVEEAIYFYAADFVNISAANNNEIINVINNTAKLFKCRLAETSSQLLIYPTAYDAEIIQVIANALSDDANDLLKFPISERSYIKLYKNNVLLHEKNKSAEIETNSFATWDITTSGNIILSVDGTPVQDQSFSNSDFNGASFSSLSIEDWAQALNNKFAGITARVTPVSTVILTSNKIGSTSSIQIYGGSYLNKIFSDILFAAGQDASFQLNRQNGATRILGGLSQGDTVSAGLIDAKGAITSRQIVGPTTSLGTDGSNRSAEMVIVADAQDLQIRSINLPINGKLYAINMGSNVLRILAPTTAVFKNLLPNDYLYIANRGNGTVGQGAILTVTDYTAISGALTIDGNTYTAGVDFTASSSNIDTATAIAVAINSNLPSGMTCYSTGEHVVVTKATAFSVAYAGSGLSIPAGGTSYAVDSGTWFNSASCGLYKVSSKGDHTADGVDTYIEVLNDSPIAGVLTIADSSDLQAFSSDVYPQIWKGSFLATPPASTVTEIVNSINSNVIGVIASIYRTSYIKLTSATENGGSIAVPVSIGNCTSVFISQQGSQFGNQSHIASKVPSKDLVTTFLRTTPVDANVWLDRHTYTDVKGLLSANNDPSTNPAYGEILTSSNIGANADYDAMVNVTSGSNRGQIKSIKEIVSANEVRTNPELPTTTMDYIAGDEYELVKASQVNPNDNMVVIFDKDAIAKTIDLKFSRQGRVNSGSQSLTFIPSNTSFSANDDENEPGIDFGTLNVWGTASSQTSTNFNNYAVLFRARNWYVTGGSFSGGPALMIRANEFGLAGEKLRFKIGYPAVQNSVSKISQSVSADSSVIQYIFGSGLAKNINISAGAQASVTDVSGSYIGLPVGGKVFQYQFGLTPTIPNFSTVAIGDVITLNTCGFTANNSGVFSVRNVNDTNKTIDVYNPNGVATIVGVDASYSFRVPDATAIDGTFFTLSLPNGQTIAYWYDLNDGGTTIPTGALLADFNVEINTVLTGMTAIDVATETATFIQANANFTSASNSGGTTDTVTVLWANEGPVAAPVNGSPSTGIYSVTLVATGVTSTFETVAYPSALIVMPLVDTSTSSIATTLNDSGILNCAILNAGSIILATHEDYLGAIGYGYDPVIANNNYSDIRLYDSYSYIGAFQNLNPNFTLKRDLLLSGVVPFYRMDTTVNADATVGEIFKLVPITYNNMQHQLVHKAISQLKIIANVDPSNDHKRLQLKSRELGSNGAIEVVGGRGNAAQFSVYGEADLVNAGQKYLQATITAYPETFNIGDYVKLQNVDGVRRYDRLSSSDTIDVAKINDETYEYRVNHKVTNFNQYVKFTIVDGNIVAPSLYPTANKVWRWQFNDAGKYLSLIDATGPATVSSPGLYDSVGVLGGASALHIDNIFLGNLSSPSSFDLSLSDIPSQGDYVTFTNAAGDDYAVWFAINGNLTAPTGATYISATNKIRADILSTDTPNQCLAAFASAIALSIVGQYSSTLSVGATIADVNPGDLLLAYDLPIGATAANWRNGNLLQNVGDSEVSGLPIIKVDAASRFVDVANPYGLAMTANAVSTGTVQITAAPVIPWTLDHSCRIAVAQSTASAGIATLNTVGPHHLNINDVFALYNNDAIPTTGIVLSTPNFNTITYATAASNGNYSGGAIMNTAKNRSRYTLKSLGYNSLFRLQHVSGDSPMFVSCGVAVDDLLILKGNTFASVNNGEFRVLAVDETSIIFENSNGKDELNTIVNLNNASKSVNWTANFNLVSGVAGVFENVFVGAWVKKTTDSDSQYRQVIARNGTSFADATEITLGSPYSGTTSISDGVVFDQENGVGTGQYLDSLSDIITLEGDSTRINDSLHVSTLYNINWFSANNSGKFSIQQFGINTLDHRFFLRVANALGSAESNKSLAIQNTEFYVQESFVAKMSSIKKVENSVIDLLNPDKRILFLSPGNRAYKWTQTNRSNIINLGKLGFNSDIVTGIDGYTYYTGLLRTVQRIIDGFEPDQISYPGRKAVGGVIEILPPLPRRVTVAISVTTQNGVNLSEITNEIKSSIINYIGSLGVGEDVILSNITVKVMGITGVAAVTFITPVPSTERITINSEEKASIVAEDISIA